MNIKAYFLLRYLFFFIVGINAAHASSHTVGFNEDSFNDVTHGKIVDPNPARKYHVDFEKWFSSNLEKDSYHTHSSIKNLINRFNLKGKSVLSIAAGDGNAEELWFVRDGKGSLSIFDSIKNSIQNLINRSKHKEKSTSVVGGGNTEESWFVREGKNTLTIFDIDENNAIEKGIQTGRAKPDANTKNLVTFYIGDFLNSSNPKMDKYDVIYISGLTPVEVRVSKISAAFLKTKDKRANLSKYEFLEKVYGKSDLNWPSWEKPFHSCFTKVVELLNDGGIFIYQKYYGGPDTLSNPNYLKLIQRQFLDNGLVPIEFYTFKDGGAYLLMIGYKGSIEDAKAYFKNIQKNEKLEKFHGRASGIDNSARLVFSLE